MVPTLPASMDVKPTSGTSNPSCSLTGVILALTQQLRPTSRMIEVADRVG
jgi:hypothetical protein